MLPGIGRVEGVERHGRWLLGPAHADLAVTWGKLWVKLMNHAAGGITDKDFEVARQIEDTVLWRPGDDSALEGTPNKFVFSKS